MALLSFSPKACLLEVAEYVGLSPAATSRLIDALVVRKLVARRQCQSDRRQISLALTAKGAAAFADVRRDARRNLAQQLQGLSATKRNTVVQAMEILSDVFGSDATRIRQPVQNLVDSDCQGKSESSQKKD